MPVAVINPVDGDNLVASSIVANVTEKIRLTYESHETGATTNGALRHSGDQIDDPAITELTAPSIAALNGTVGVHSRLDMYAVALSAIMGTAGSGYAAKYTALGSLTYKSINDVNTALTTGATVTATGSALVRRAADGSASFAATSTFANLSASGTISAVGAVSGAAATFTGIITAGAGANAITTTAGLLDASKLTNALPAASFPAVAGDVAIPAGTPASSVVSTVGGKTAAAIAASINLTAAAASSGVGNHGALAKFDGSGGMTFDAVVTAPSFAGVASNVPATGITGTILATQIDTAIARAANVPTNAGVGATGVWPVSVSGNAATASSIPASGLTGILSVTQGGLGVGTLPAGSLLVGHGAGVVTGFLGTITGQVPVYDAVAGTWSAASVTVPDYSVTTRKLGDGAVLPDPAPLVPPNSLRVYVNALKKFDGAGNPVQWSGGYLDLSSYVPGSGTSVWVMIYLNATAAVYAAAGAASATPTKPQAIGGQTPLAYVLMYAGQINVAATDIYEWRTDFSAFAVGGGTGSGYSAVGHLHGQGSESFVAVAATDEGRVTTPSAAGMTVYVQPTRYTDTNGAVQQFGGGPSATIARPVSFPYYAAIGLSQLGTITISYGAENATPVRGAFLNTTDIPLAYVLVRPGSTRTILNDDTANALIIDARRPYTFSVAAAGGIAPVSSGGTGQSSFAAAGLVYTPGGATAFSSIPITMTAVVGLGFNPTVTPAGANADLFQGGGGVVATGTTNIPGTVTGLHILASTKTGTGTIGTFNGVTIEAQTIGTTNNSLNVVGNAAVSGNLAVGGGLTFSSNLVITAATAVVAQFNSNAPAGIVTVNNHAAAATGLIESWRVNGVEQASMGPTGILTLGAAAQTNYGLYSLGGGARHAALANPAAPTIGAIVGGAAASYWYWIVAQGRAGNKTLISPTATTAVGPTAFAATTNTVALSWTAVPGAVLYYILRTTSSTAPTGAATVVSGTATGTTYVDAIPAASLTAMPGGIPTRNATADVTIDGSIINSAVGVVPLTVNAVAGQTADVQDWVVGGATVASLSPLGTFAPTGMRGVTAFPSAPANGLSVYREDLGAWYRAVLASGTVTTAITGTGSQTVTTSAAHGLSVGDLVTVGAETVAITAVPTGTQITATWASAHAGSSAYNAVSWRQVGDAYHTTLARPAAPPTDYRYRDLTDRFTYRWTGSAYQKTQATIKQLDYVAATDLLNGAAVVGTPTNVCADQTFTVSDAGSQLDVFVVIAGVHTPGASPSAVVFTVYVDSTTSYVFSQSYGNPSSNQSFTGAAICIGSLTAGSHTVRVRYQASAATTLTLTPAANPTYYAFRLQVLERLP